MTRIFCDIKECKNNDGESICNNSEVNFNEYGCSGYVPKVNQCKCGCLMEEKGKARFVDELKYVIEFGHVCPNCKC